MTEKRYYEKNYDELYYIFDSKTLSEKEFEEKIEYDGYDLFAYSLTPKEVLDLLNENEQLKKENEYLHQKIEDLNYENIEIIHDKMFLEEKLEDIEKENGEND